MVKWLSGLQEEKSGNASPVLRLLCSLILNDGDLCEDGKVRYNILSDLIILNVLVKNLCNFVNTIIKRTLNWSKKCHKSNENKIIMSTDCK